MTSAATTEPMDPRVEIILKTVNNVIYIGEQCKMNVIKDEVGLEKMNCGCQTF